MVLGRYGSDFERLRNAWTFVRIVVFWGGRGNDWGVSRCFDCLYEVPGTSDGMLG